jgi:glycine reductase
MSSLEEKENVVREVVKLVEKMNFSGVIINQEGGANTLTEVMMVCRCLESENIKTVLVLNEFAGADGKTPSLAETTAEARHIISTGNNDYRITLQATEKCIGPATFPWLDSYFKAKITVPLMRVYSSTNQLGFNYLSCREDGITQYMKISVKDRPLRVVHYLNQFFGQIGGEDKADEPLQIKKGSVGPGKFFEMSFSVKAEIIATIICGDNTMCEDLEQTSAAAAEMAAGFAPDILIAGPCFLAGRYGMACGAVCKAVAGLLGIPTIVGIAESNPGVDVYRAYTCMVPSGNSAAKMKEAINAMIRVALSFSEGSTPEKNSYITRGIRNLMVMDKNGATRAVEMLMAKLSGQLPETELPLPKFEKVDPAPPLQNLRQATIVLATEGGLIPINNPDHIEMSMATRFGCYSVDGFLSIDPKIFTVAHGGYDNSLAQSDPNRLIPLDVMKELEDEGEIGSVAEVIYTTAGNATSVDNATRFGREIANDIRQRFKQDVVYLRDWYSLRRNDRKRIGTSGYSCCTCLHSHWNR